MASSAPDTDQINLFTFTKTIIKQCQCPACEDFFIEPKCLPCSHSVCRKCLDGLVRHGSRRIQCPVDGKRSRIPRGDVDSFPDSSMLRPLLENASKLVRADMVVELEELESNIEAVKNIHRSKSTIDPDEAKLKIKQTAERLRKIITVKETEMCSLVDEMATKNDKDRCAHLEAQRIADKMEKVLRKKTPGRFLRRSKSLLPAARLSIDACVAAIETNQENCTFEFTGNTKLEKHLEQNGFGRIRLVSARSTLPPPELRKPFAIPDHLRANFQARAIAANGTGHIAVVDEGNRCILLYNIAGHFIRQIGDEELVKLNSPHSVTFRDNKEIIIADGWGNASHRLLVYDISGTFVETLAEVNGLNARFVSVSAKRSGRLVVACERRQKSSCIRVCDKNYATPDNMVVITERVWQPLKVLWLSGKICVLQRSPSSPRDREVNVFSQHGHFENAVPTTDCSCLAVDSSEERILLWQESTKNVEVRMPDGTLVRKLETNVEGLQDMAVASSGHLAVITAGSGIGKSSTIQLISYREEE